MRVHNWFTMEKYTATGGGFVGTILLSFALLTQRAQQSRTDSHKARTRHARAHTKLERTRADSHKAPSDSRGAR